MSQQLQTIVVEDEPLAREGLLNYVRQMDFLSVVGVCEDALEANRVIGNKKVDLMFLDVQMPVLTGIDFLRSLKNPPMVIMTTAYPNFALESFELDVIDYLVKPFPFERFFKAVNKANEFYQLRTRVDTTQHKNSYFFAKCNYRYEKIQFEDVMYVEGMENYVVIHTRTQKFMTLQKMKVLEETLPSKAFVRIHKSYIVSVAVVSSVSGNGVMVAGKQLPISRERRKEILMKLMGDSAV